MIQTLYILTLCTIKDGRLVQILIIKRLKNVVLTITVDNARYNNTHTHTHAHTHAHTHNIYDAQTHGKSNSSVHEFRMA